MTSGQKNIGGKAAIALNFYERYCMPVMEYSGTNTWRGLQAVSQILAGNIKMIGKEVCNV